MPTTTKTSTRPRIPADIERTILHEAGHRCAVCGTPFPLELAHIVPWRVCKEHTAENLICLCANCHERADREWNEATLRKYKEKPWVLRPYQPEETPKIFHTVEIRMQLEIEEFDEKTRRWLQYALASFLDTHPDRVEIKSVTKGSVKVAVRLMLKHVLALLSAFEDSNRGFEAYLGDFQIMSVIAGADSELDVVLSHELIAGHAYELWNNSGKPPGTGDDFWMRAEKQLLAQYIQSSLEQIHAFRRG